MHGKLYSTNLLVDIMSVYTVSMAPLKINESSFNLSSLFPLYNSFVTLSLPFFRLFFVARIHKLNLRSLQPHLTDYNLASSMLPPYVTVGALVINGVITIAVCMRHRYS